MMSSGKWAAITANQAEHHQQHDSPYDHLDDRYSPHMITWMTDTVPGLRLETRDMMEDASAPLEAARADESLCKIDQKAIMSKKDMLLVMSQTDNYLRGI